MGSVNVGVPEKLTQFLGERYGIENFIETGTYLGDTSAWAAKVFKRVFTIEASKDLYSQALIKNGSNSNIQFNHGHTKQFLANLVPQLEQPSLFWLDAHWSGGVTYGSDDQCPLLEEIRLINTSSTIHFLLIDDARLFLYPPPPPQNPLNWPSIDEVIRVIQAQDKDIYVCVFEDVIFAVPSYAKADLMTYLHRVQFQ